MNLDSLLDILSNVVGVMVLLAVMTVLASSDMQIQLGTPQLRDPPPRAERLYYECRDNHLYFIDEAAIRRAEEAAKERFREASGGRNPNQAQLVALYRDNDIGDANYRVVLGREQSRRGPRLVYVYQPRETAQGVHLHELTQPDNPFARTLRSLDSNRNYISFIVRTDSFDAFSAARRAADNAQIATGWTPLEPERSLRFEVGGDLGTQVQ